MKDIKSTTRSGSNTNRIPIIRSTRTSTGRASEQLSNYENNLSNKVEAYERSGYADNEYYTRKPKARQVYKTKKRYSGYIYTFIFIALIAIGYYLLTYKLNSVTVDIKVRSTEVSQNGQLTLSNASTTMYDVYSVSDMSTTDIKKSNVIDIKTKAKGMVTIYNNNDSHAQKLVKNTRLEAPDGKIYRISSSIIVPGKVDNIPGSVSVLAIADTYGSEYNVSISKFTVPGFKGNVKYNNFYAKSNGVMTGGDMGKKYIISDQDIKDAEAKLVSDLEAKIREKIKDYKNDDYVIVRDNIIFTKSNNKDILEKDASKNTYEQNVKGTILIIKKSELVKAIARSNLSDYNGSDNLEIADYNLLKIYNNVSSSTLSTSTYTIGVEYKGNIKWIIDSQNISNNLVGKGILDFAEIMKNYTGVDSAVPSFMPMWSHTFPNNKNKIHIKSDI